MGAEGHFSHFTERLLRQGIAPIDQAGSTLARSKPFWVKVKEQAASSERPRMIDQSGGSLVSRVLPSARPQCPSNRAETAIWIIKPMLTTATVRYTSAGEDGATFMGHLASLRSPT
jgi:hypothetical protein